MNLGTHTRAQAAPAHSPMPHCQQQNTASTGATSDQVDWERNAEVVAESLMSLAFRQLAGRVLLREVPETDT